MLCGPSRQARSTTFLKPFDNARFDLALDRAKQKIARGKDQPRKLEFLTIKSAGQVTFVSPPEIDWIEAADYYAGLHVGPKTHLLRRSISELEQDLDPRSFLPHSSLDHREPQTASEV